MAQPEKLVNEDILEWLVLSIAAQRNVIQKLENQLEGINGLLDRERSTAVSLDWKYQYGRLSAFMATWEAITGEEWSG